MKGRRLRREKSGRPEGTRGDVASDARAAVDARREDTLKVRLGVELPTMDHVHDVVELSTLNKGEHVGDGERRWLGGVEGGG